MSKKKICKVCGEVNSSNEAYCTNCQASLNGAKIKDDTKNFVHYGSISSEYIGNPPVVSTLEWIIIMILLAIPLVNIIALIFMSFFWSNDNIRNFGRAVLILAVIGFVLAFILRSCNLY